MTPEPLTHTRARGLLILAAVLWSSGSVFMRLLSEPLGLGLDTPLLTPLQVAFYRGLFGGVLVLALVARSEMAFRPRMALMMVVFTVMSGLYLSALGRGPAANAIFLQNTAPLWVYVFAVLFLHEPASRRGWETVLLGAAGAVVIVAGNWPRDLPPAQQRTQTLILLMGLGSGITYAVVVLFLRTLREHSSAWLVALNLLGTAVTLGAFVLLNDGPAAFGAWVTAPTARQVGVLVVFGAVQMALPYWLFTRSLRAVPPQEAAIITLLEPLLNPVWAYLITPEKDTPNLWMFAGGGLILLALVWQYLPRRALAAKSTQMVADKPLE
ncbi:DMT family transporter [Gemmata sp. JC717]|uniref:DMT family transporter n=1 Tax=Gemmata algarum TaxID=2975278 RepID=UPI0021BB53B7|nr:DMT family transporter [Gemmata algarum]MDY3552842.1 DMT family transporter [Gemmata algarum]